jgi:5-methyltetrahydropteroyltriglutamate--homocysteine methyltransferase
MRRSEGRFRTTHVGSLIRPAALLAAVEQDPDSYREVLAAAVAEVVAQQAAVGLDAVNDGEFGKSSWSAYVLERVEGFEIRPDRPVPMDWLGRDRERFAEFFATSPELRGMTALPAEVCVGPITYTGHAEIERDLRHLRAATAGLTDQEVFVTSVAPASVAYSGINEYYRTEEEYVAAIADALREEYRAIHRAGFLLQVDDAVLANMYDHLTRDDPRIYRRWAQLRVDALNHALEGIPRDRVRYHVCFGSWHVPHVADAELAAIVDLILQVEAGAYLFEAANVRHEHEVDVWRGVSIPDDSILVPGVITHHTTTVEHPELVARRLLQFADIVGPQRVIGGTDCGFAQAAALQRVHPQVVWAKFAALVEGARIASARVWK